MTIQTSQPLSLGDRRFAAEMYGHLRSTAGNLAFSPASVRMALAMTWAGARGETAAEMGGALAVEGPRDHEVFEGALRTWRAREANDPGADLPAWQREMLAAQRVTLRVANRLWGQAGYEFRPEFIDTLRTRYVASLGVLDFASSPENSRCEINRWVSEQTEGKIVDLLSPGDISTAARMVLTNAVYFKASWSSPFMDFATEEGPFWTTASTQVKARLMNQTGGFPYFEQKGAQIVELPYASEKVGMVIVLPTAPDDLPRIEKQAAEGGLDRWAGLHERELVHVTLPKFRSASAMSLAPVMESMGMSRAFRYGDADFSGIDGSRELFISEILHQAFVAVDEHGTEAAAATAVVAFGGGPMGQMPKPKVFRADRPFLYFVRDRETGQILFMGRVVDPSHEPAF